MEAIERLIKPFSECPVISEGGGGERGMCVEIEELRGVNVIFMSKKIRKT